MSVKAGELVSKKESEEFRERAQEAVRVLLCGGIFSNEFLEEFGYYHRKYTDSTSKYDDTKGIWIRVGVKKDGSFTPLLDAVDALENVTEDNVIGGGQESKFPGE